MSTQHSLINSTEVWENGTPFNTTTTPLASTNSTTSSAWSSSKYHTSTSSTPVNSAETYTTNGFTTNGTHMNTTYAPLNSTQMPTGVNESTDNSTNMGTTNPPLNSTQAYTGLSGNSTFINSTAAPANSTQYSTPYAHLNSTQPYTTLNVTTPTSTTISESTENSTYINSTAAPANSTQNSTPYAHLNSTQPYTTLNVTTPTSTISESAENSTYINTTAAPANSTENSMTYAPLNSTQPYTTVNDTTPLSTTINESTENSTYINSTAAPANSTQYSTSYAHLNSTVNDTTQPYTSINDTTPLYTTINETAQNSTLMNVTAQALQSATTHSSLNLTDATTTADALPPSPSSNTTMSPPVNSTESFTPLPPYQNTTVDYNGTVTTPPAATPASHNTSSSPTSATTVGVSAAVTATNGSSNMTSSITALPVLNQTVSQATTPEQMLPTMHPSNVSMFPVAPNSTATPTTSTTPRPTTGVVIVNGTTTAVGPAHPDTTVGLETKSTTTTTATTEATRNTTEPPGPVKPSLTTATSVTTETTTTTTTTTVPTTEAATTTTTTSSPAEQANHLLNQTKDVASMNATQIAELVSQLESLLSGPNVSLELGRLVLSSIGNLLNASAGSLRSSSSKLIKAVDTLALKLVLDKESVTLEANSLVLSVTEIDGSTFQGGSFLISSQLNQRSSGASVRRAQGSTRSSNTSSLLDEGELGLVTLPSTLTENLSAQQVKALSRLQFNFYSKPTFFQDSSLDQSVLNSNILSASASNLSIRGLRDDVEIVLRNNQPIQENVTAVCVFWDFDQNDGSGGWSSKGCFVKNASTQNETICSCNHLTSFAVLMDLSREGITDPLQARILSFITFIGCGISAIFLAVTLLTYISFEKIRRDIPAKILIQLCLALLLLNLTFLLDSWLALYRDAVGLCISTAWFLHYFLLASFTWMGLEALHMYLAIVKVFNSYMSRYMLKFSLMGWGIPLPVVIIIIAVDKDNYGLVTYGRYTDGTTDDFCWLRNDVAFYVGVVAFFCLVFVLNLAMFIVVMVQLHRVKRQNPHNNQYRSGLHDLRSVAGLTFLLGLTWGFAFFAWGPVSIAFSYLFAIFNSLQGFFIFVFHCAMKDNVRRQWRIYLCCGSLRLAENSDWSRTATQNNTKKSSLATTSSVHSSNSALTHRASRNSSVADDAQEHSNGIRSPFDDTMITALEDANGDVILNEMNNHNSSRRLQ
ncbi:adhesion G-protein coupled receptor G2 [Engraulis encrasicolus]|uniref:adhesion G-protein coupled receptor G2 n=1 Tax=Engraulis encrasicolus TaxID=184585 RepID=UPI002FD13353